MKVKERQRKLNGNNEQKNSRKASLFLRKTCTQEISRTNLLQFRSFSDLLDPSLATCR